MFLSGIDVTKTHTSEDYALGSLTAQTTSTGTKIYKFVLFNNGVGNVAAVAGNFAYIYAVSGASAGQLTTVTMDLTDTQEIGAGVFQSVPADGEYCWIQVTGSATLTTALTAGGDGDPLTPTGSTDGTLDVTTASTDHICAVAVDASAKIVLLYCPL
jgi:hypothetical protein